MSIMHLQRFGKCSEAHRTITYYVPIGTISILV